MPSVSKKQQKFMGIVRSIQKGEQPAGKFSKAAQDAAKKMKKSSVKKYAKTKHDDLPVKKESLSKSQIKKMRDEFDKTGELPPHLKKISKAKKEFEKKFKVKDVEIPGLEWMSKLGEAADRDYKAEYKKFQSSTKAKKYRAELNKYNRQKGTYGNGDGKDASHKGGKIVGFEKESTNRGRAEKSRLKKEDIRLEIEEYVDSILEDLCLCEACQKGYMTHPTRKTKIMFGKRYRNCIKKEDVNEESKVIKSIDNLAKKNKYGTVTGTQINGKTANTIMKIYNHPKMKKHKKALDNFTSDELVNLTVTLPKTLGIKEAVYKLKRGSTNKDLDELDALLARAGFKGKPDFNKMTWSIKNKNPKIAKIIKSKGGKKIREGTCGYGIDGKIGEEPAGPNLMKKIKKISKDKEKKKILKSKKEGVNERLNQSQAKTLLRQLGGNKFIMMTGAKQMSIGKNGLTMKIGRNSKSITHVAIDLDRGKDLYIMKFIRVRKGIPKVVKQYDGIYADNLNNIFEKETGLYTRL